METTHSSSDPFIPDWMLSHLQAKFDKPEHITRDRIQVHTVLMKDSGEKQLLAYTGTDIHHGVFVIFEPDGTSYREVFSQDWVVAGIQIYGMIYQPIVLRVLDTSGTGFAYYQYRILRYTDEGFQVVWEELAHYHEFFPRSFNFEENAGIAFEERDSFVYYKVRKEYEGSQPPKFLRAKQSLTAYEYNQDKKIYEPSEM